MGGDVHGAVEVWEAEQALEGMEDEEMEFDDDIKKITSVYVQPCDENDDDEEVVCTGERKAEEHVMSKKTAVVCCPFEFEGPTTCTELDVKTEMECVTFRSSTVMKVTSNSLGLNLGTLPSVPRIYEI